jgi:hypothetical protein
MRDITLFAVVTATHLVASVGLMIYTFTAGMARFDSGTPAGAAETIAGWLSAVLSFPLVALLRQLPLLRPAGLLGYTPFAANAALWGMAVVAWRRRRRCPDLPTGQAGA